MTDATVSVVIPTYGRDEQLRGAVRSVLLERDQDLDVVVVDDATPGTPPDLSEFRHAPVRLVRRAANGGVAAAQNSGLEAAVGDYVAFLHSDDEWIPGRLDRQLRLLESATNLVAGVESATLRRAGSVDRYCPPRMADGSHVALLRREVRDLHISGWLFKTAAVRATGGFDETLRCYEDLDLLLRLTKRFPVIVEAGPPVVAIDVSGTDRLASSPWMSRGRRRMVDKYLDEVDSPNGLPPGWRDWCAQVALDLLEGDGPADEAVALLRRARAGNLHRAAGTAPLLFAARAPGPLRKIIVRSQRRRWRR